MMRASGSVPGVRPAAAGSSAGASQRPAPSIGSQIWRFMPNLAHHQKHPRDLVREHVHAGMKGLNVGSQSARLGPNWINLDVVAGPEVDVVADAHAMPFPNASFDAAALFAVLQYCEEPRLVLREVARILRPGGVVLIDSPFVQPYCPETGCIDRYRFSRAGLVDLVGKHFEVLDAGTSIGTASAMAMILRSMGETSAKTRALSGILRMGAAIAAWPLARFVHHANDYTAGAVYVVGRRPRTTDHWEARSP